MGYSNLLACLIVAIVTKQHYEVSAFSVVAPKQQQQQQSVGGFGVATPTSTTLSMVATDPLFRNVPPEKEPSKSLLNKFESLIKPKNVVPPTAEPPKQAINNGFQQTVGVTTDAQASLSTGTTNPIINDETMETVKSISTKVATLFLTKLGEASKAAGTAITNAASNAASQSLLFVKSIPGRIVTAAKNKVDETVEEIKAMPGKMVDATQRQIKKTIDNIIYEIRQIPIRAQDAINRKTTEIVDEIKAAPGKAQDAMIQKTNEIVDEVQAMPGKVATSTKTYVETKTNEIKDDIENKKNKLINDIKSFPDNIIKK